MNKINRRTFIRTTGALAALGSGIGFPALAMGAPYRVVIVGGGVGGATAAKYLRKLNSQIEVILIESKPSYTSCFMSNEVLSGERTLDSLTFGYDGLRGHGVTVIQDTVTGIDPTQRRLETLSGTSYNYDACVVSPGIDFQWEAIEGYNREVSEATIPHAWNAGPQTQLLRNQIKAMPEGGTVLISAPPNPFNLNSSVGQAGVCVQACAGQGTTTRNSQLLQGVVT